MSGTKGEAGDLPLRDRNSPSVTERLYESIPSSRHGHEQAMKGQDNSLPSFFTTEYDSDFESQHVLPRPRDYRSSSASGADRGSSDHLKPIGRVAQASHSDPVHSGEADALPVRVKIDSSTPEEVFADDKTPTQEESPPRPRIPGILATGGPDDFPRKLIPYSVLEQIARDHSRAQSWPEVYPEIKMRDRMAHSLYGQPLGYQHEPSGHGALPKRFRSRSETYSTSGTGQEGTHGNDDLGRYALNKPREYRPWHRPESSGSHRLSPYPRHRPPSAEYRWYGNYADEDYDHTRYSNLSGSHGNHSKAGWAYPSNYSYGPSGTPFEPSISPHRAPEIYHPYERRRSSNESYGPGRKTDLLAPPPEDITYETGGRTKNSPGAFAYMKHKEGAHESPAPQPMLNRATQGRASKNKNSDGAQVSESQPKRGGKLPKPITDMLKSWLLDHADHPYPTEEEKRKFCEYTGLDICQISNWVCLSLLTVSLSMLGGGFSLHRCKPPTANNAHNLARKTKRHQCTASYFIFFFSSVTVAVITCMENCGLDHILVQPLLRITLCASYLIVLTLA